MKDCLKIAQPQIGWPFPSNPFEPSPTFPTAEDHIYALAAGEFHSSVMLSMLEYFRQEATTPRQRAQYFVDQLSAMEKIDAYENMLLGKILDVVFNPRLKSNKQLVRIEEVYRDMKIRKTSPLALAVAGIAVNSAQLIADGEVKDDEIIKQDVVGGLFGSLFGPVGALIGGAASSLSAWVV